jgi:hypothetical protein
MYQTLVFLRLDTENLSAGSCTATFVVSNNHCTIILKILLNFHVLRFCPAFCSRYIKVSIFYRKFCLMLLFYRKLSTKIIPLLSGLIKLDFIFPFVFYVKRTVPFRVSYNHINRFQRTNLIQSIRKEVHVTHISIFCNLTVEAHNFSN